MAKTNNALIEQAYNAIHEYLMNHCETRELWKSLEKSNEKVSKNCYFAEKELYSVMRDLRDAIQQDAAKTSGKGNLRKSMMNILKWCDGSRPVLQKALYDKEAGCTVVCDGYSLIKTSESVELPTLEEDKSENYINYKAIIPKAHERTEVTLPTIAEVKAYMKLNKGNLRVYAEYLKGHPMMYFLKNANGEVISAYNAKWLLNILEAVGDGAKGYLSSEIRNARMSPILIQTEETQAILCPMRCVEDESEKRGIVMAKQVA